MTVDEQIKAAYETKVTKVHNDLVRTTGIRCIGNLSLGTPVGNPDLWKNDPPKGYVGGRARANWNIALNTILDTTTEETTMPDYNGIAVQVTSNYKQGDTIYITNNLPYIQRLNDGYSTQAPANFVEKDVALSVRQAQAAASRGGQ